MRLNTALKGVLTMTEAEKKEMEKILENVTRETNFLKAKKLMEIHEKWKEKHSRPKHNKGGNNNGK